MSTSTTKRRVANLASLSTVIAAMVVAAAPAATLAAGGDVVVRGETLLAKIVNPTSPVTGNIDATGFDIAVYFGPGMSGKVDADVHGAKWYGVVADRANVTVTDSRIHDIGDDPLSGMQHGNAVFYYNGAHGTISGNKVYDFQKNGITVSGKAQDGSSPSDVKTSASVLDNVVTGNGPIDFIAQNGIQVSYGARAVVAGNTIRGFDYTPDSTEATGLLNWEAARVVVSGNRFSGNEIDIYGAVKRLRSVHGSFTSTLRAHRVRIDFRSEAQPANSVLGKRLHWVIKVDGRSVANLRQRFRDHDTYVGYFASGTHTVEILKNGKLVKSLVVKA